MKTRQSLKILYSLFVRIQQNFEAFVFFEKYLCESAINHENIPSRKDTEIDSAITESLWFQIILQSCSFLEEWDSFLAIKTDKPDNAPRCLP